mmetsp:Transcript_36200/g.62738  ORF Transcript_36200/g.62738 Transcript_36200/m.62738 type:complete len:228 (-) Transcript_36200:424-1107(-)
MFLTTTIGTKNSAINFIMVLLFSLSLLFMMMGIFLLLLHPSFFFLLPEFFQPSLFFFHCSFFFGLLFCLIFFSLSHLLLEELPVLLVEVRQARQHHPAPRVLGHPLHHRPHLAHPGVVAEGRPLVPGGEEHDQGEVRHQHRGVPEGRRIVGKVHDSHSHVAAAQPTLLLLQLRKAPAQPFVVGGHVAAALALLGREEDHHVPVFVQDYFFEVVRGDLDNGVLFLPLF